MSQYFQHTPFPESSHPYAQSYTWRQVWTKVILQPSTETFEDILADPYVSAGRAYSWIIGTAIAYYLLLIALTICVFTANGFRFDIGTLVINSVITGVPVAVIAATVGFTLNAGLTQIIARLFGGRARFGELAYALASVNAPMVFLAFAISFVLGFCLASAGGGETLINLVSLALGIYGLVLQTMAIKVAQKFGWGATIGTVVALIVIVGILVFAILNALGPSINEVFEDILRELN